MFSNGRDLAADGWILIAIGDWMRAPTFNRSVIALPGIAGVIPGAQQTTDPRTIELTFRRYLTSILDRDSAVLTLKDRLRGKLWVRFDDAPTRVIRAVAGPVLVRPTHALTPFSVATIEATVTLTCYDAASYDTEPRILALATTPTEIPLGDLPSIARIMWGGAWTATTVRTLILRDVGGVPRQTITFTAPTGKSLASTDHHEILTGKRYVTKVTSGGTRTNEYDWYTSGGWLVLDPAFQDRDRTRYATVEISAGTAQIIYRKAYGL